jgi:D-alanyl-D-alanine carboxypeptidase/D-alanyl-D-alanine-endopeptidase (penicillin-binding protein 4)
MGPRPLAVAVSLALGFAARPGGAADLAVRLAAALEHPGLRGARVATLVVRAGDGTELFARAPERALIPASNMKILTALAALETFGPTHRFTTRVWADRLPAADGAVGLLAVEGGGDPALTSEQWWRLAADLRRAGLRRVEGGIVLDADAFDDRRWNEGWGEISSRAYHAPVGALSANYGAFQVEIRPGARAGEPAVATLDPPVPYLRLRNRARTRAPHSPTKLLVERAARDGQGERVTVSGALPTGSEPKTYWRSVSRPALYAGAVLRMQLEALEIEVSGPVRLGRVPEGAQELLAFEGESLARVVSLFVKYSNNLVAETLLKGMGRAATGEPGSWQNGRQAMLASLSRLELGRRGLVLVDGSGLSRANRVTPRTLVGALRIARRSFRFGPELVASLPIAAGDGTLAKRAEAIPGAVRAKTGLLDGVTGLSGFARGADGELVFSILANGYRGSDEQAMAALDGFAAALAGAGAAQE